MLPGLGLLHGCSGLLNTGGAGDLFGALISNQMKSIRHMNSILSTVTPGVTLAHFAVENAPA
jgi:hypothetical protein